MYDPVQNRIDQAVEVLAHYMGTPKLRANSDFRAELEEAVRNIVAAAVMEATERQDRKGR